MVEPTLIIGPLVDLVGEPLARRIAEWVQGSEAKRLVDKLKRRHPAARHMLTQPAVLQELWFYAETGELREAALVEALKAIADEDAARRLAAAVRTTQWQAIREDRRLHWELERLRHEMQTRQSAQHADLLARIEDAIARVGGRLPAARGLPAELDTFVDRGAELDAAEAALVTPAAGGASAVVLACSGMPGAGKSRFALHVAHRHAARFPGGVLYADFRRADGARRTSGEVATQLLRDLGVGTASLREDPQEQPTLLRSLLAETPVLMLLDNAAHEQDVRPLVPANPASVVIATSTAALSGIGTAAQLDLDPLAAADGLALLRAFVGERADREPQAAQAIVDACHGLPIALSIAGAKLRGRPLLRLSAYADELADEARRLERLRDRERALMSTFAASVASLEPDARRLFLLLAALDVSSIEPPLCAVLLDAEPATADAALEQLELERLLEPSPSGVYRMHDLLRLYGREQAGRELQEAEIMSARARRVQWLADAARAGGPDATVED